MKYEMRTVKATDMLVARENEKTKRYLNEWCNNVFTIITNRGKTNGATLRQLPLRARNIHRRNRRLKLVRAQPTTNSAE